MTRGVKTALIAFVLVLAVNITVITIGIEDERSTPTPTPQPSVTAAPTPTLETTATVTPDETPAPTATNAATPTAIPEAGVTATPDSPTPTPAATNTTQPTATANPTQPAPTPTAAPTATQPVTTPAPTSTQMPTQSPNPTQTAMPTPTQTSATISISAVSQVQKGNTFIIDINIYNVAYMACAGFDLQFNSNCISYSSCEATSQIGGASGTVLAMEMQPGLLRVTVDYTSYANTNSGYGVSGSGYLCKLTFAATATGTSPLNFVAGMGEPTGELTLLRWLAYNPSTIENVIWVNSSITVVN